MNIYELYNRKKSESIHIYTIHNTLHLYVIPHSYNFVIIISNPLNFFFLTFKTHILVGEKPQFKKSKTTDYFTNLLTPS